MTGCAKKKVHITSLQQAVEQKEKAYDTYESGKDRVVQITQNIERNVVHSNAQQTSYAHVQNIAQDLNVEKIADFFDCKTVMGRSFLIETLQRPVSPTDTSGIVDQRKKALKMLLEYPEFKEEVDRILTIAADQEQFIIQLMSDFFIGKMCPELQNLALLKKEGSSWYPVLEFCNTSTSMKTVATALNVIGVALYGAGTVGLGIGAIYAARNGLEYGEFVAFSGLFGVLTAVYGYNLHDDISKAAEKRSKMYALNQVIQVAEQIEQLSRAYHVENQFKMSLINDLQGAELIKGLKHSRYKKKKNYCFHAPAVHTFLYKIYQNDKYLAQMFASIAEMDAYNAIATKMLASENSDNKICFAEFLSSDKPVIESTKFWNLLIPNAIANDMVQDRHIILTGPNAGGKTSAIRAILQNIMLAQTYGIAAAQGFKLTPFDTVLSYLNISDDLIKGSSLFASEIKRAQELLTIITSLLPRQKLFFALDELFTGTAADQGEQCAYEFIKKIATFDQVLSIYATHFNRLKDLGANNLSLMNYKVNAPIKNKDATLIYPFTLSPGASDSCVALDMAKQAGLFN